MRIVYDIQSPTQVTTGANPWIGFGGKPTHPSKGFKVDITIAWDDEAIHIEGDAKEIREAMMAVVEQIDNLQQVMANKDLDWEVSEGGAR